MCIRDSVYTGLHQTPEQVVQAVVQEDADAVGLSLLSGAHLTLVPRVVKLLADQGLDDVLVIVGGIIPEDDIPSLKAQGVAAVFTPAPRSTPSAPGWARPSTPVRTRAPDGPPRPAPRTRTPTPQPRTQQTAPRTQQPPHKAEGEGNAVDLYEYQGKQYFARFGIPTSPGGVADTVDEAVAQADAAGYPVCLLYTSRCV